MRVIEVIAATGQIGSELISESAMFVHGAIPADRYKIDVTARPEAVLLGTWQGPPPPLVDDWTVVAIDGKATPQVPARVWVARAVDTFLPPPTRARSTRVSKTAFLGVIPPALYKAWATSTDQTLMYAKALFDADTTVDVTSPAIAAVFAQAQVLNLIDAPTAAQLQAAIAALVV